MAPSGGQYLVSQQLLLCHIPLRAAICLSTYREREREGEREGGRERERERERERGEREGEFRALHQDQYYVNLLPSFLLVDGNLLR